MQNLQFKTAIKKSKVLFTILVVTIALFLMYFFRDKVQSPEKTAQKPANQAKQTFQSTNPAALNDPLVVATMRKKEYPGSQITIEQTLPDGPNYHQYLTSYKSQGLKIYALLTVPATPKPKDGYPVIVFNHGYITPQTYQTFPSVGQYASYYPVFSEHGYIVFKPDYRGNGNSEGKPEGAYYSPAYTIDDLNAIASIKQYKNTNPNKLGVWGHSMGGNITLRDLVVEPTWIKAAVIWGGVVGSSSDLLNWHDPHYQPSAYELALRNANRQHLVQIYGTPETNPDFWNAIDPTHYVTDIQAPVQLHQGLDDEEVPSKFSEELYQTMKKAGKTVQLYEYPGADHNISQSFDVAMQRSLTFFDTYLK